MRDCQTHGVGTLTILEVSDGDLPWNEWKAMLSNKAQERGIQFEEPSLKQPATVRAKARTIAKKAQKIQRAKEGLQAIETFLGEPKAS